MPWIASCGVLAMSADGSAAICACWPGVRRAGLPRQSPALTPGRGAAGAALDSNTAKFGKVQRGSEVSCPVDGDRGATARGKSHDLRRCSERPVTRRCGILAQGYRPGLETWVAQESVHELGRSADAGPVVVPQC